MTVLSNEASRDWYLHAFDLVRIENKSAERAREEVDRALALLEAGEGARVLDLACGLGEHTRELARRGLHAHGVDVSPELIEIADGEAELKGVDGASFEISDLRYVDRPEQFDAALSLGGGAIGYLEDEGEDRRAFERMAGALRPGGRHLAQLPNLRHHEERLRPETWHVGDEVIELVSQRLDRQRRRLEGSTIAIHIDSFYWPEPEIGFSVRLYGVAELEEIYASVGMRLLGTFDESGRPADPSPEPAEIFVLAEKL